MNKDEITQIIKEDFSIWRCPECGATTYTEIKGLMTTFYHMNPGLANKSSRVVLCLYECDGCSRIFGNPKKFSK